MNRIYSNDLQLCLTFFSDGNEEPTNTSTKTKFTSPTWSATTSRIITHPVLSPLVLKLPYIIPV